MALGRNLWIGSWIAMGVSSLSAIAGTIAPPWSVSDVSYLYPLPRSAEDATAFRTQDTGTLGVLFPRSLYDQLKPAIRSLNEGTEYSRLRVVGVRIDPCGEDSQPESGICYPEVRMVWQPFVFSNSSGVSQDGAFHTFYRLNASEWSSLLKQLRALKTENEKKGISTTGLPLAVHPAFKTPWRASFQDSLRKILLEHCGEKRLFQITVMREETAALWHRFEALRKSAGGWKVLGIPRVNSTFQDFFNDAHAFPERGTDVVRHMKGQNLPQYFGADSLEKFITGYHVPDESNRKDFTDGIRVTHRLENPLLFTTANLDCAHCHLAAPARFYFTGNLPRMGGASHPEAYRIPESWLSQAVNVTLSGRSTKNLRAFGYYFEAPTVSTRTIHESIRVAEKLSSPTSR